jgi:hypothetical protein
MFAAAAALVASRYHRAQRAVVGTCALSRLATALAMLQAMLGVFLEGVDKARNLR